MREQYDDDHHVAEDDGQPDWRRRFGERFSTWLGAGLGLLLIVCVVVWGYRLGQRDATAVPVIRAALEPAKVQPDEPGGAKVPHQDISSYSAGADGGAAKDTPPTKITFAPPPDRPAEEDVAMGALKPLAEGTGAAPDVAPEPAPNRTAEPASESAGEAAGEQAPDTVIAAVDVDTDAGSGTEDDADAATEQAPASSPVVIRRPGDLAQRMAAARRAKSEEDELAARAAASPVQIQLGAFPDRNVTKAEWKRIYRANEDILQGRALVVQSTISGGRRFFRLRAGPFRDRTEAQNVCRALQARDQDCIVAVTR